MRAAIGGLLLRSPDHTALHRRSRAARFASLMLTLQTFDTLFLESALPFRDCGRARAQPPFDLTIAQAIGQCQNEPGPENVPGRQTTRLRPSLQFIALFITELQCLIVSHSIMTLQSCCMFQWDRPLVRIGQEWIIPLTRCAVEIRKRTSYYRDRRRALARRSFFRTGATGAARGLLQCRQRMISERVDKWHDRQ